MKTFRQKIGEAVALLMAAVILGAIIRRIVELLFQ